MVNTPMTPLSRLGQTHAASQQPDDARLPVFATPKDAWAAMKARELRSGDTFMTPDGQIRIAK
jgi:hypothetical protein